MDIKQIVHMNEGTGETSYAKNSVVQNKIISVGKPIIEEAVLSFCCTNYPGSERVVIADLGCSSGPNTMLAVSDIMDAICRICRQLGDPSPEFQVFLNDLPGNDFNTLFRSIPAYYNSIKEERGSEFGHCYIAGMPGSFYGRLFPRRSLHFVHSSSSLHWLSQVPPGLGSKNKGKLFISKTSPPCVLSAYALQFQKDFTSFLHSRSEEMVAGGRMVLSLVGRRSADPSTEESCHQWEFLAQAMQTMVIQGLVEEKKLDSFNAPYYSPSAEELRSAIQREGSFAVDRLDILEIDWDGGDHDTAEAAAAAETTEESGAERVMKTIRAVVESMLTSHFGGEMMDELFRRYRDLLSHYMSTSNNTTKYTNIIISMSTKLSY
ncbi:PREDICTED: jasmonate O-methyltransferase-like [Nelumbo nucifera]|uniref:Jasmonate O-methyltransferase-like n=2 Tax=Nelumbo nucifera TaxID=4432 RepID=A0A1U7ZL68_NELNU|nr:PREDICTED: jasmonate O-methyltransferase-like [Nelumbo nucifera]DAD40780.1 TPA_asm: hypothetical protein HUJ06_015103 [Nelumbo nucifera]